MCGPDLGAKVSVGTNVVQRGRNGMNCIIHGFESFLECRKKLTLTHTRELTRVRLLLAVELRVFLLATKYTNLNAATCEI